MQMYNLTLIFFYNTKKKYFTNNWFDILILPQILNQGRMNNGPKYIGQNNIYPYNFFSFITNILILNKVLLQYL